MKAPTNLAPPAEAGDGFTPEEIEATPKRTPFLLLKHGRHYVTLIIYIHRYRPLWKSRIKVTIPEVSTAPEMQKKSSLLLLVPSLSVPWALELKKVWDAPIGNFEIKKDWACGTPVHIQPKNKSHDISELK